MSAPLDRLTLLETFIRIAERGSISAAGRDLDISQASASRRLAELESRLGASLVDRTTHRLSLTADGEAIFAEAYPVLAAWERLTEAFQNDDNRLRGGLTVVAPIALGQSLLADAAARFLSQHPEITLQWRLTDEEVDLTEAGVDLWISAGPPGDDRLIQRPLAVADRLIVSAPELCRTGQLEHPRELAALPCIAVSPFEGVKIELAGPGDERFVQDVKARMTTSDIRAALAAVRAGAGYMIAPRWLAAEALEKGQLIDLAPDWRPPSLTISAAYPVRRRGLKRLEALLAALTDSLQHTLKAP